MHTETRRLRRTSLLPAVLTVCLAGALASCSDDSDPASAPSGDETSQGSQAESDGATEASQAPQLRGCRASVETTGDAEASWEGKGEVRIRTDDPDGATARYTASQGDNLITVYTPDADITYPAVTFSQGKQSFTTDEEDASEIQVDDSGAGASAEVSLRGLEDTTIDLVVSFTCGKQAGGSAGRADQGRG